MGVALTDVLLFGKAQSDDVDNATLVIYRRNILRWSALGGYLDIIVKGASPLSLPDAIADSLEYLKVFGGTEQRNIPQPYTQVNYVTNIASTAVDTGIMIDFAKNYEFEVECRAVVSSWFMLQSRESESLPNTGISGSGTGSTIILIVGGISVCTSAITRTLGNRLYIKATLNNGVGTLYVKDITAGTEDTVTGTYSVSTTNPTTPMYLLGNAAGQYVNINSDIYMARIKENDTVVMDYVPARQVATAGFYDTVSGTFKTALTPANLSADGNTVPTPDYPMDIVSNNGVLKVSRNLFNVSANPLEQGGIASSDGQDTASSYNQRVRTNGYIPVKPSTVYTASVKDLQIYYLEYAQDKTYTGRHASGFSDNNVTFTTGANTYFIRLQFRKSDNSNIQPSEVTNVQLEQGSTATPYTPYSPTGIYTDGTVETINVHGKNLFDGAIELGSIDPANGSLVVNEKRTRSANFIPVQPNTTYTLTREDSGGIRWIVGYDKDKNGITDGTPNQPAAITNLISNVMSKTFTTTPTTHYIKWYNTSNAGLNEKVQIEVGSTATDYEPYFNGGTATAEMLLKVGGYQDEQEILSGAITRNIGVVVLNGTEAWSKRTDAGANRYQANILPNKVSGAITCLCSHFQNVTTFGNLNDNCFVADATARVIFDEEDITTLTDWQTWLAAQYAAGTPVIIVYPLATPTTESVAGQALQVQAGDNTIEITQASLDNLEIEAKYQAAVSLTIQEVQDANLDPNVQVTIN